MKPVNNLFTRIFLFSFLALFFLVISNSYAQVMPVYHKLDPITSMVGSPIYIFVDANGAIYIAESSNHRVRIYSQSGQYQETIAGLSSPKCVTVDSGGRIIIGNEGTGSVRVYDADLNFLWNLGEGSGIGEFDWPSDIAVDSADKIYIADRDDNIVKIYNPDGTYYDSIGSPGAPGVPTPTGQFNKPTSIEIVESGGSEMLIVLDRGLIYDSSYRLMDGARIQKFDMDGTYIGGFDNFGFEDEHMRKPQHFTVDSEDRLYISDSDVAKNEVLVYNITGGYLGTISDEALRPIGIAMGASNRLYITALTFSRIDVYGIEPFTNMGVSPLELSYEAQRGGADPASQNVTISNDALSTLNWTATENEGWITLSDTSGSAAPSATSSLTVGVDIDGLLAGSYSGSIDISGGPGATEVVEVTLTVNDIPLIANPGGPYYASEGEEVILDGSNSIGSIVSYAWDIGADGSFEYPDSSSPTQSHIFNSAGFYYIRLRVTDDIGLTDESTGQAQIIDAVPEAAFTGTPTVGDDPLTVDFTNNSTGLEQPLTFEWDFGDGTTDTSENPTHTYNGIGSYTVMLTATDSDGSEDTLTKTQYITVNSPLCDGNGDPYIYPGGPEVRIMSPLIYYSISEFQTAYNDTVNGGTIQSKIAIYSGDLIFDLNKPVVLEGGYDCSYSAIADVTRINGNMTVSSGTVTITGNFVLE